MAIHSRRFQQARRLEAVQLRKGYLRLSRPTLPFHACTRTFLVAWRVLHQLTGEKLLALELQF